MTCARRLPISPIVVAVALLLATGHAAFAASAVDRLSDEISQAVQQALNLF